jgi:hypothetical protein
MFDGVFLSTNGGANWQPASQGLTSTWVNCLAIRPPYAYAATSFGGGSGRVWRRLLTDLVTSVEEERGHIPARTSLDQNYPNPFNPSTKIVYRVRGRESVKLKVYDVLGREISTLVDEVKAPGSYELTLDASSLPSGVYLYRLTAGSFKETKKLIVLK